MVAGEEFWDFVARATEEQIAICFSESEREIGRKIGEAVVTEISGEFGGSAVYLSRRALLRPASDAARIVAEFDGKNHRQLAKKYQKTEIRIRQILAAARNARMVLNNDAGQDQSPTTNKERDHAQ